MVGHEYISAEEKEWTTWDRVVGWFRWHWLEIITLIMVGIVIAAIVKAMMM